MVITLLVENTRHMSWKRMRDEPSAPDIFLNNVISMYSYRLNENRTVVLCLVT